LSNEFSWVGEGSGFFRVDDGGSRFFRFDNEAVDSSGLVETAGSSRLMMEAVGSSWNNIS